MSTKQVLENKGSYIRAHLKIAESLKKHSLSDIEGDNVLRAATERELYLIVQATIDLAEAYIAYKSYRRPTTMREAFDILAEEAVIPADFAKNFGAIVGFRNALAHAYEDLKTEILLDVLMNRLKEVKAFLKYLEL